MNNETLKVEPITVTVLETPAGAYTLASSYRDWAWDNRKALCRRWLSGLEEGTDAYAVAERAFEDHMSGCTSEFTHYCESQFDLFMAEVEDEQEVQQIKSFWEPK